MQPENFLNLDYNNINKNCAQVVGTLATAASAGCPRQGNINFFYFIRLNFVDKMAS